MTPEQIVKENFQGLDELIQDKELLQFYKDLIVTCIKEYSKDATEGCEHWIDESLELEYRNKELIDFLNEFWDKSNFVSDEDVSFITTCTDLVIELEELKNNKK